MPTLSLVQAWAMRHDYTVALLDARARLAEFDDGEDDGERGRPAVGGPVLEGDAAHAFLASLAGSLTGKREV